MRIVYSCVPYFSCAVATFCRGALLSFATLATFAAVFIIAAVSITFAAYLLPFSFLPFQSDCVPCSCGHVCRTFAPKRLQRSFHAVLSRFKRVICVARTFAPFAPFRALIEPYLRQICRF